jgi:uncharacterized protein YgiM (DUF1202 family)
MIKFIALLVAIAGVTVALCAWLFPFHPVGQSPMAKPDVSSSPPAIEQSENQKAQRKADKTKVEPAPPPRRELQAVINDPDGYTNVRSGPGTQYEVLSKIVDNETFYVVSQQGSWWQVRTQDGTYGYMHRSRIKMK